MYDTTKIQELFDEASGLFGMIAEVKMKLRLLKQRSENSSYSPYDLHYSDAEACDRMSVDLDIYRNRLTEIDEELQTHGVFDVDEGEGALWPHCN